MKPLTRRQADIDNYNLQSCPEYWDSYNANVRRLNWEIHNYGSAKIGIPERNMLKALRLCPRLNTPEDWGRLHAYEAAARNARKPLKTSNYR